MISKSLLEVVRNTELQDALKRFQIQRIPVFQEIVIEKAFSIYLNVNIAPVQGLPLNDAKTIIVFHNITKIKELEQMQVDFLVNSSHELKTPLTSIIGFMETLQAGAIQDKTKTEAFLQRILKNAMRLDRIINDLLLLSRIEQKKLRLMLEQTSVGDIIHDVISTLESAASEKSLSIISEIPDALPRIFADKDKVFQILLNVVDNAIKYTQTGNIKIKSAFQDNGYVLISVIDTGIGIHKRDIQRLGERFYRVDHARSRELGGTGLGLSIVKELMKAHQGKIKIESILGEGTTVWLYFPVAVERE